MKHVTPMKAIRLKCLDCSLTSAEVKLCPVKNCPLWPYRMGKRPSTVARREEATEETKRTGKSVARTGERDKFGNMVGTQANLINEAILSGKKTLEDLVAACELSTSRVNNHLKFLVGAGHIELVKNKIKIVKGK